jgi:hypothetical protein
MNNPVELFLWSIIKTRAFSPLRPRISRISTICFEGLTRESKKLTAIAFADNERANYFCKMAYDENPHNTDLGRSTYKRFEALIQRFKPDIVFVDTHRVFSDFLFKNGFFVLPYLQSSIDISDSIDSVTQRVGKTRTIKKKMRWLSKIKLTCRISRDPAELKDFYYSMYVPRILERHKQDAKLVSFEECLRLSQMGGLMLLMLDGEVISGVIYVPKGDVLYIPLIGINFTHQSSKKIAGIASTYFLIRWAKEQGFSLIDYGGTKPFLKDGVFIYKRQWGMSVKPMKTPEARICAIKFCNFNDAVKEFLQNNPFVFSAGTKLYGLILSSSDSENFKEYSTVPGLSGIVKLANCSDPSLRDVQLEMPPRDLLVNNLALSRLKTALTETGGEMLYLDFQGQGP